MFTSFVSNNYQRQEIPVICLCICYASLTKVKRNCLIQSFNQLKNHKVQNTYFMGCCNNNNLLNIQSLSRVDVVLLFWSLIPVFPLIQTVAYVFCSQSNFIGSYFLYSPRRQAFLIDFICVLLIVLWVAVSGIPPFSNLFLLMFSF